MNGNRRFNKGQIVSTLPRYTGRNIEELDLRSASHSTGAAMPTLEERAERTQEEKDRREKMISTFKLTRPGSLMILRHRSASKSEGGIFKPQEVRTQENLQVTTATVVSTHGEMGSGLAVGDKVYFSVYAPFSANPMFPEVQILHENDVIAKLENLDFFPDVIED